MMVDKLLSIVIVGRNDDYLGGYRYRLQSCLDFLAMNLRALDRLDDVEVLFVDWNSEGSVLSDEIQLTDDAARLVRFVLVPPKVAYARNASVNFFTTCAVNVGVRRARGEFVMLADSDCIMPLPSLKALLEVLDGTRPVPGSRDELIYPIPRHQIPGEITLREPNVKAWEHHLSRLFPSRRKELPGGDCLGGFSAAQLMHRKLWFEFGGYSERLGRAWGWSDNDLMLRVTRKYAWADLGFHGVVAFHIQHHAFGGPRGARDPDSINQMWNTYTAHPNPDDWGLESVTLEERSIAGRGRPPREAEWKTLGKGPCTNDELMAIIGRNAEVSELSGRAAHHPSLRSRNPERAGLDDSIITAATVVMVAERPRNVLYVGAIHPTVLLGVIYGNPGIDIFLSRCWQEGDVAQQPSGPDILSIILATAPFMGYARILNGPTSEVFETLRKTEAHSLPLELAIIHREDVEEEFNAIMGRLLLNLAPGGTVIVSDEKRRLPMNEDALSLYYGRQMSRARRGDGGPRTFVQYSEEDQLGRDLVTFFMRGGAVHFIHKPIAHQPVRRTEMA